MKHPVGIVIMVILLMTITRGLYVAATMALVLVRAHSARTLPTVIGATSIRSVWF